MDIAAVVFDVNGTLIDISTEDGADDVFRAAGHLLTYQGIDLRRTHIRDRYFQVMSEHRQASPERHPEYDAVAIWRQIIDEHATAYTHSLDPARRAQLPQFLAELTRGVSRHRLRRYPYVRKMLGALRERFALAVVTDAQSVWARAELHKVGLLDYFDPIVVSGDHGFRKPDRRLFQIALDQLGVAPDNAIYVGNDMYRDVFGAREAGMRTVLYDSTHGSKHHRDTTPDFTITDYHDLLAILGVPAP